MSHVTITINVAAYRIILARKTFLVQVHVTFHGINAIVRIGVCVDEIRLSTCTYGAGILKYAFYIRPLSSFGVAALKRFWPPPRNRATHLVPDDSDHLSGLLLLHQTFFFWACHVAFSLEAFVQTLLFRVVYFFTDQKNHWILVWP